MKAVFSRCGVGACLPLLLIFCVLYDHGMAADETRFSRSADGVITDSQTNLQWLVGPNQDTNYKQAEDWVATQTVAGGGWRMPTAKELRTLYDESFASNNHISPVISKVESGAPWFVWAKQHDPSDSLSALPYNFWFGGFDLYNSRQYSRIIQVFAVRPRR